MLFISHINLYSFYCNVFLKTFNKLKLFLNLTLFLFSYLLLSSVNAMSNSQGYLSLIEEKDNTVLNFTSDNGDQVIFDFDTANQLALQTTQQPIDYFLGHLINIQYQPSDSNAYLNPLLKSIKLVETNHLNNKANVLDANIFSAKKVSKPSTVFYQKIFGNHPINILLCAYKDSPPFSNITGLLGNPINKAMFQEALDDPKQGLKFYWNTVSQGKFTIDNSKVYGWYRLPFNRAYYVKNNPRHPVFQSTDFQAHCMNLAAKDGFNATPDSVYGIVFVHETTNMIYAPGSTSKGHFLPAPNIDGCYGFKRNQTTKECKLTLDGQEKILQSQYGFTMEVSSYLNEKIITRGYLSHEIGHGIGWDHSSFLNSTSNVTYSNQWDIMSSNGSLVDWDWSINNTGQYPTAFHRYRAGWFNTNQIFSYQLGDIAKTVNIDTNSLSSSNQFKMILLNFPNHTIKYTVEVRGAKNSRNTLEYFDRILTEPVVIVHRHIIKSSVGQRYKHNVVNPGGIRSENSFTESVMLRKGESWTAAKETNDTLRLKVSVTAINARNASIKIESIK